MKKYTFAMFSLFFLNNNNFTSQAEVTFVTEHLPPYQIINEDASVGGFATEIILAVAQRANINYKLYGYPWIRTYNLALKKIIIL